MDYVNLATAATLLDQSERTLRRRIAEGILPRLFDESGSPKIFIPVAAIHSQIVVPLDEEEMHIMLQADKGDAEAQNDMGMIFLENDNPEGAVYWFESAAKQDYADAMHWLARCYFEGNGVRRDDDLGMLWLTKAALHGHVISKGLLDEMKRRFSTPGAK